MKIDFGTDVKRDGLTGLVYFSATVDGLLVRNCICEDALRDCFVQREDEDNLRVFERERAAIQGKAADKIRSGDVNESGGADLTSDDFT